jgi:cell division protein FtsB
MRLVALALVLVAAALYVSPLRAFFAQQDRYDRQVASLSQAQARNQALHTQIDRMHTRDYITRQAREQYQLVPAGLQAFVVKGLPDVRSAAASHDASGARPVPPSLLARLADLWRTIRE